MKKMQNNAHFKDGKMKTVSSRDALRKQLGFLKTQAIHARLAGGQPPHGLDVQLLGGLDSMGLANLNVSRRAARYAVDLRATAGQPWDLGMIDRLIDRFEEAQRELST
jgi:hypothetical protein